MIIDFKNLSKYRKKFKDKKIILCTGTFDLTHSGHVLFFEDCKKLGDLLFVAVGKDTNIKNYKGGIRPVLNEHLRLKMVDSLKPVDFTYLDAGDFHPNDNLKLIRESIENLKPNIYIFNDDAYNIEERKNLSEKYPVEVIVLKRWYPKEFGGISTTQIIEKIQNFSKK